MAIGSRLFRGSQPSLSDVHNPGLAISGGSLGHVEYDVTALNSKGLAYIQTLAEGFESEMQSWASNIERACFS